MARDKAKDDRFFNCAQYYEIEQVASHYDHNKAEVLEFLKSSCTKKVILYSTHMQVYQLIKEKLGYPIPV